MTGGEVEPAGLASEDPPVDVELSKPGFQEAPPLDPLPVLEALGEGTRVSRRSSSYWSAWGS